MNMTETQKLINKIIGKTPVAIYGMKQYSEKITFRFEDGIELELYHKEDCYEEVALEDINGNTKALLDTPIIRFDEKTVETENVGTATFYTIRTRKGSVDLRWVGTSNGNYSERVAVKLIEYAT